jgi:MAF protein
LVLASQSPRRRELLELLGLPFDVTLANVAESAQPDEAPAALVARLSQVKAYTVERQRTERGTAEPREIIVACDTAVALDDDLLGKPPDPAGAITMLRRLRGRSHAVYTAVSLLGTDTGRALTDVVQTEVEMRSYSDAEIAAYVASGDPMDKAGAYAIQHPGFHPVAELEGCYANVMGLPLCHLTRHLRAWGFSPPYDTPAACQAHTARACAVYATILAGHRGASPL